MVLDVFKTKLGEFPIQHDYPKARILNEVYRKKENITHNTLKHVLKKAYRNSTYFRNDEVDKSPAYGLVEIKFGFRKKILISFPWKDIGSVRVYLNKEVKENKVNKVLEKIIREIDKANFSWSESLCLSK
ncbi:MAG: hypothetical protein QF567_01445 [Candidatus Pacearchaeota archaeon]|jgi:hypothetical protein|nr:hypothetical protein [Candidatus Pacearchaeota archaeon]MDP7520879.1 hypothetical protein [Candidatus Pacearchaeota archaeon]|tara:strand:- start:548 stop:937 length:390 start_codon:yes stop_codon:yes gene_type:complete